MGSLHLSQIVQVINMRVLLALALFIPVASAFAELNSCEQKNQVLKKAIVNISKKNRAQGDCSTCYNDILAAVTDCILSFEDWKVCVEDILGAGNPCIECVCEVIVDISQIFGQDWHC